MSFRLMRLVYFVIGLLWLSAVSAIQQIPFAKQEQVFQAHFNQPTDMVTDAQGQLYILDSMNSRVVIMSAEGKFIREINKSGSKYDFYKAMSLGIYKDVLYVADTLGHRIRRFSLQGEWLGDNILPLPTQKQDKEINALPEPVDLLISRENEQLIYADRRLHQVCFIDLRQQQKQSCIGERGEMEGQFQYPFQIAEDRDGYLNVVDVLNARVQVFNHSGQFFSQVGHFSIDRMYRPNGNVFDFLDFQYISDAYLGTVSIYQQGRFLGFLRDNAGDIIKFKSPVRLSYDPLGYLYVVDAQANQIQKIELGYHSLSQLVQNTTTDVSRKNCVLCHYSWGDKNKKPLSSIEGDVILPVASTDMCYSCHHGAVFDSRQAVPHNVTGEYQHPTLYDDTQKKQKRHEKLPRKDKIPTLYPHNVESKELLCTSCHTPHNDNSKPPTLYTENHNAWLRGTRYGSKQCEACHESHMKNSGRKDMKQHGVNHPLGVKMHKPATTKKVHLETQDPYLQKGLPKILQLTGGVLGKDDALVCQSCHQVHNGVTENLLTQTDEKGALCASCHQRQASKDKKSARKAGVHPVNVKLEEPVKLRGKQVKTVQCDSCHSVHNGTLETALYPDKIKETEALCVDCHKRQHAKDEKEAAKKGIHPINVELEEPVKIAGIKVKKIGCLSCHSIHSGKPNTPALLQEYRNGELCENCHQGKQRVVGTDHDLRVTAKKSQNQQEESPQHSGVCGSCHTLHRGDAKAPFLSAVILKDKGLRDKTAPNLKVDALCLNCHQKKGIAKDKAIEFYGHPYKDMVLRSDEKIMPLIEKAHEEIDEFGVIACMTCHEPHTWKPLKNATNKLYSVLNYKKQKNKEGDITNSFLRHKGVEATFCVSCHGIESLSKYKYFHDKEKVRSIGVDYLH